MDALRLGVGVHLPQGFLTDAAVDYLTEIDYDQLGEDWAEEAYAELSKPVHGKQAPLRRTTPRPRRRPPTPSSPVNTSPASVGPLCRLADYLEQYGRASRRSLCPPASSWDASHAHLTQPHDLDNLVVAARARFRLQWANHLRLRAADQGSTDALRALAVLREETGDREGAEDLARRAADHGSTNVL
ncbi:hypothetical protein ABZU45_39580 [Streptomyces avermitilis]|uniref:hypothetical protein n=1 Tax=Streptomyces avermitilis TaxID=33903 RepID=UPI0033BE1715